jgi:hypothetical protein
MSEEDKEPTKYQKVKKHLKENKKIYLAAGGGMAVGASVATAVILRRFDGFPLEISQTAKNTALIVWKPEINQIALVKKACPDPIPVLDKLTGEAYPSLRRAVEVTGETLSSISKDAQGAQDRFERLPDSVFA